MKVVEKIKTPFVFSNFVRNCAIYEIMSKNMVEPYRPQMTIWRCVACWIIKATRAQASARLPTHALTHTHTQTHRNMQHFLLFQCNNGFLNAPQCYVLRTLPVFLYIYNVFFYVKKRSVFLQAVYNLSVMSVYI